MPFIRFLFLEPIYPVLVSLPGTGKENGYAETKDYLPNPDKDDKP